MRTYAILLAVTVAGCARTAPIPPITLPFPADTTRDETIAPGVVHRYIRSSTGPWAIHALDVDLSRCYSAVAVKGGSSAAGRRKTSDLLNDLRATSEVIGGVNADFFSLSGYQGIPTGALITKGRVMVGPYSQPVLAIDSAGSPRALVLSTVGAITTRGATRRVNGWNRPAPAGLAVYDASWGAVLDTATGVVEVIVEGRSPARVVRVDTSLAGAAIPRDGSVIIAGRTASDETKAWARALAPGDTLRIALALAPFHPMEAVGGRPMLARDGAIAPEVDTEGQVSFRNRNPRTAVGIANDGKRLILVVVDGRQAGYSAGMTLRELATLMLALGARDAINLDGGGSSALVHWSPDDRRLRVANKPSDANGERAVGNALGVVKGCR
ncbi:MAG TPA: phosphodiester glycosidase family protein [Gemmatimonadaceae bacterium]|nr:phosphodiester glycosidase family protein [Gemmatimonadaceae bacterium]